LGRKASLLDEAIHCNRISVSKCRVVKPQPWITLERVYI